jgi:multidrug efflux pump subunit AcrB
VIAAVAAGCEPGTVVLEAVRVRLRPALVTGLTTIAALVPTTLAIGSGGHVFQPFAVTVIAGLVTGTIAILTVLPAVVGSSSG